MNDFGYLTGDLFQLYPRDKHVCIAHVCNDERKWGAGFSGQLSRHFHLAESSYRSLPGEQMKLGECQVVHITPEVAVANMIAQHGIVGPGNPHPLDHTALESCMRQAHDSLSAEYEFHCPMFGAGLAGGNWEKIVSTIESIWLDRGRVVRIYKYLPPSKVKSKAFAVMTGRL